MNNTEKVTVSLTTSEYANYSVWRLKFWNVLRGWGSYKRESPWRLQKKLLQPDHFLLNSWPEQRQRCELSQVLVRSPTVVPSIAENQLFWHTSNSPWSLLKEVEASTGPSRYVRVFSDGVKPLNNKLTNSNLFPSGAIWRALTWRSSGDLLTRPSLSPAQIHCPLHTGNTAATSRLCRAL